MQSTESHPVVIAQSLTSPFDVATHSQCDPNLGRIALCVRQQLVTPKYVAPTSVEQTLLFSFVVGNDAETSSGKSALELCWETLQRVQDLNRRITLYTIPNSPYDPCREQIERSGKFFYFLIRVAGIAGGDVAAAKFMDDPRNDCRVRDYLAEERCPNYLIESFTDVPADPNATFHRDGRYQITRQTTTKTDQPWSSFSKCAECGEEFVNTKDEPIFSEVAVHGKCKRSWLAKHPDQCELPRPEPRFQQVTPEDVALARRPSLNNRKPTTKTQTFCPRCSSYDKADHECQGDMVNQLIKRREQEEQGRLRDASITLSDPNVLAPSQILQKKGGYSCG